MSKIKVGDHVVVTGVVLRVFKEDGAPGVYLVDTGVVVRYFTDPEVDLCENQPDPEDYEQEPGFMLDINISNLKSSGISELSIFKMLNYYEGVGKISIAGIVNLIGVDEALLYISSNVNSDFAKKIILEFAKLCSYSANDHGQIYKNMMDAIKLNK